MNRLFHNQFVLIAEIGVNYYDIAAKEGISPMEAAKKMIAAAKKSGIHAVKFQSYKAETLAAKQSPAYWDTTEETETSQYRLFKKFDTFGYKEYRELAEYCDEIDIEFLSTAFDMESADYLEPLMNVYKISSSDLNNHHFVEYQAKKGKPILLSVGASRQDEIAQTIQVIRAFNQNPIVLMHCVLEYPTPYEHANLNKIVGLQEHFPECIIGYSDHTKPDAGYDVLKTAYTLGANIIEKHFTLDKTLKGNDHYHAMDEKDAERILQDIQKISILRGSKELRCLDSEKAARRNARRSLVAATDIKKGTILTQDMITFKRPGTGIPANEYSDVIGRQSIIDIAEDTILTKSMIR